MRAFFASILLLTAVSGCRAEGACAIDSDCPIRFRCAANVCTALGTNTTDSGASVDASAVDTGVSLVDAFSVDAGPLPDANSDVGPVDAFSAEDAFGACPMLESDYSVSSFSRGCSAVAATRVMFMRSSVGCSYSVSGAEDISGTVALTDGTLSGTLTVGTRSYPDCTLTQRDTGQVTIACGTICTVALLPLL